MTKYCSRCKKDKTLDKFGTKKRNKDGSGLQSRCKECRAQYHREWYEKNKELHKKRIKVVKKRNIRLNRAYSYKVLSETACFDCKKFYHPAAMDFDHVRDKYKSVSRVVFTESHERLVKEIEKCKVRCANCHRIKTAREQGWYKGLE